jgi:hypothetical protein
MSDTTARSSGQAPDLIPDILPSGSICLLSGPAHSGKSALIASQLGEWRHTGRIFGRVAPWPKAVILLASDHRIAHNQGKWLERAGLADCVRCDSLRDDPNFKWSRLRTSHGRITVFEERLIKLAPLPDTLLVPDPLALFVAGKLGDYTEIAIGLGEIGQVIGKYGVTIWGTAHTAKQLDDPKKTYKRPIDRVLGSGGQIGFGETAMNLVMPDDNGYPYYQLYVDPPMVPPFSVNLRRTDSGLFVPWEGPSDEGPTIETEAHRPETDCLGVQNGETATSALDVTL